MINVDGLHKAETYDYFLNQNYFLDKELSYQSFKNATILPFKDPGKAEVNGSGGIMDEEGKIISDSFIFNNVPLSTYNIDEEIECRNETVVYIGMLSNIWGNALTDMLRKIWFLKSDYYKKDYKDCPIVCTTYKRHGLVRNVIDLLKVLEVDMSNVEIIRHPTKFQSVILPDPSFIRARPYAFTKEYIQSIEQIKRHQRKIFTHINQKSFYFSYPTPVGGQFGEDRLSKYFHSKGYEVLRPELFSFDEQLNIMANCKNFASTVGSCSFNTIFMQDHTEVILMPRSASRGVNPYQSVINQINDRNIFYLDTAFSLFVETYYAGPFCYFIGENLRKFFGDDTSERFTRDDFETFIQYSIYARKKGFAINDKEKEYHIDVLTEFFEGLKKNSDLLEKYNLDLR